MVEYFSHDYHARSDPKIVKLILKHGMIGVGVYWCIIESLYEQGGKLHLNECERIAFELHTQSETIKEIILSNLFENDGEFFWSNSVIKRLAIRTDKSQKAANSAKIRWNNANAMRTQCDSNAIKVNKSKEKETKKDVSFDAFWEHYPKKVGKGAAKAVWKKQRPPLDAILKSLSWQIKSEQWTKNGGQYIPNPATYLNQGRWEDEPVNVEKQRQPHPEYIRSPEMEAYQQEQMRINMEVGNRPNE